MSDYTPVDAAHSVVDLPENGENANATNLNTAVKNVADNAEVLRQALLHVSSADVLTPGARGTEDGVKRLRSVASGAALAALVVGASNDKEIVTLKDAGGNVQFMYDHGNTDPVYEPFIFDSFGSTGRWVIFNFSLLDAQPGLPYVDEDGRLQNIVTSPGMTVFTEAWQESGTGIAFAQIYTATDDTDFAEASALKTTAAVKTGDVVDVSVSFSAACLATGANRASGRGIVGLAIESSSGTLAGADVLATAVVGDDGGSPIIKPITLHARYVAVSDGTVDIQLFAKTNTVAAGSVDVIVYTPLQGSIKVTRP